MDESRATFVARYHGKPIGSAPADWAVAVAGQCRLDGEDKSSLRNGFPRCVVSMPVRGVK